MHPAYSVIFFTVLSGAGYGLMFLLGLLLTLGAAPTMPEFAIALCLALVLAVAGLLSSTFHLGHPERAWRAFSQWRTSWLSREGILAVVSLATGALLLLFTVFGVAPALWPALGLAGAILAVATVVATAMIYASLEPVPDWRNAWTLPCYLAFALASGTLALNALLNLAGQARTDVAWLAVSTTLAAAAVKIGYWRHCDRFVPKSTPESATGLENFGRVRALDAPHTQENYLLKEMGYQVARKHAARLRRMAMLLGFLIPAPAALLALWLPAPFAAMAAVFAFLTAMIGLTVERWLFFAEARHLVTLYYGRRLVARD